MCNRFILLLEQIKRMNEWRKWEKKTHIHTKNVNKDNWDKLRINLVIVSKTRKTNGKKISQSKDNFEQ